MNSLQHFTRAVIAVILYCTTSIMVCAQFSQQGPKLVGTGSLVTPLQGLSVAVSGDGNTAIVGAPLDDSSRGAVWIFTRAGGTWSQQGSKLIGIDSVGRAEQGLSVAISADGNTVIFGGPNDDNPPHAAGAIGAAWVFTRTSGVWSQQGSKLVGTGLSSFGLAGQGMSVALSADGNTALVGGWLDSNSVGATWVFTRTSSIWSQQGNKLVGTGGKNLPRQGYSVALSGDGNTAIVGGNNDSSGFGASWIFVRNIGVWTQQGNKLVGTGAVGVPGQGESVSISGDGNTALVGGPLDNSPGDVGATWVFIRTGFVWSQQGSKLLASDTSGKPAQGYSVSLSGDGNTALVGGPLNGSRLGAAWIFSRAGSSWSQLGNKLVGSGSTDSTAQGYGVSLSSDGSTALIGGPADSTTGATWVFVRQNNDTITASAGAHGSISPSGTVLVQIDSSQKFTITPDLHYSISDVLVDNVSVGAVTQYTFNTVTANHTISAAFVIQPAETVSYRSFTYDSLIVKKSLKKKNVTEHFRFVIENNTGSSINQITLLFKNAKDTIFSAGGLTVSDTAKYIRLTGTLLDGDSVTVIGRCFQPKPQVISKLWLGPITRTPTATMVLPEEEHGELPMPNAANVRDDLYNRLLLAQGGLIVGDVQATLDSARKHGWVRMKKTGNMYSSLVDRNGPHTGIPQGFLLFKNNKPFVKEQSSLPPGKQNNRVFADLLALKFNIALSNAKITPLGFGALKYVESGSPFANMYLRDIASYGDSMMTYAARFSDTLKLYGKLDTTLMHINAAFSSSIDTSDWSDSLKLKTTIRVIDTGILESGSIAPISIRNLHADNRGPDVPRTAQLYQNYPNPFNPTTNIRFDLPAPMVVTLKVYNILGQEVITLIDHQQRNEGIQNAQFDGARFASGIYFYRLIAQPAGGAEGRVAGNSSITVRKMVLVK
ncbi:MAG: T9SS type A sorting domain-containing protein [Bacteroidota bacterium]